MPTFIKELPSKEWFEERYCIIDNFVCWKPNAISRGRASTRAGRRVYTYVDDSGYYRIVIDQNNFSLARIIYQMHYGDLTTEYEVDHIDQNKLNNEPSNLRKVPQAINKRNKGKQRNAGDRNTGVCLCKKKHPAPYQHQITEYYVARWYDIEGKLVGKAFRIDTLGKEEAYKLACEYRAKMIAELNEQGAGHTDRHGT